MKLDLTEKFIVWGILGSFTDDSTAETVAKAEKDYASHVTEQGSKVIADIVDHEKSSGGIYAMLEGKETYAFQMFDAIDDYFIGKYPSMEHVEFDVQELIVLLLLMAELNHDSTIERISGTIDDVFSWDSSAYDVDLEQLLDYVSEHPASHLKLYGKIHNELKMRGVLK